jgi:hypothetical protein
LGENELELELFLDELRDNKFESMMYETHQKLEVNFENYANQHGISGELESMLLNQILITLLIVLRGINRSQCLRFKEE